jgi:hypothetical protein
METAFKLRSLITLSVCIVVCFALTAGVGYTIEGDILKQYEATLAKDDDGDEDEKDKAIYGVEALVADVGISTFA